MLPIAKLTSRVILVVSIYFHLAAERTAAFPLASSRFLARQPLWSPTSISGKSRFTRLELSTTTSTASGESVVGYEEATSPASTSAEEDLPTRITAVEAITSSPAVLPNNDDDGTISTASTLSLWTRRLITHEDPFGIHKWSSLLYTASSAVFLGTAAVRYSQDLQMGVHDLFPVLPDYLEPWATAFTFSNIIMCVASLRMSFRHRAGDLTARNAFLGTALSSLFSGFFFLWMSPFPLGDVFNTNWISQACFASLILLNAYFIMDTMVSVPEVVEGRRDRKVESAGDLALFVRDALGYVLPIAWGLPVIAATGYQASVLHDRAWMIQQCQHIFDTTGVPFRAHVVYLQVLTSLAASYGSLFVTLRDKKLITKQQELVGITIFSVSAMIWTAYVTVVFYQNL